MQYFTEAERRGSRDGPTDIALRLLQSFAVQLRRHHDCNDHICLTGSVSYALVYVRILLTRPFSVDTITLFTVLTCSGHDLVSQTFRIWHTLAIFALLGPIVAQYEYIIIVGTRVLQNAMSLKAF